MPFCPQCGSKLEGTPVCPECGSVAVPSAPVPYIKNYMAESLLISGCCCIPLGAIAIFYSSQVNSKLAAGDLNGARKSARIAKYLNLAGLIIGLIGMIISVILAVPTLREAQDIVIQAERQYSETMMMK